jgi:putative redox protein
MNLISTVTYNGELRTSGEHVKSGQSIITDAPTDNNGKGEAFSPTDLLSTSLASCMLTIMGIRASSMNIAIDGAAAEVEKFMASNPRRVAKIVIRIQMPSSDYSDSDKKVLEHAARTCPVALSLSSEIEQEVSFHWK